LLGQKVGEGFSTSHSSILGNFVGHASLGGATGEGAAAISSRRRALLLAERDAAWNRRKGKAFLKERDDGGKRIISKWGGDFRK